MEQVDTTNKKQKITTPRKTQMYILEIKTMCQE